MPDIYQKRTEEMCRGKIENNEKRGGIGEGEIVEEKLRGGIERKKNKEVIETREMKWR